LIFLPAAGINAQSKSSAKPSGDATFVEPVEINPMFPGGDKAFRKFLSDNLKWPKDAPDVQGKVFISFIIEKDGSLTHFKVERSLWPSIDAEALRVLKKSPKWKPGVQDGKSVRVSYTLPVSFAISYE
jgi:protein TonB